jgi:hypothetical protein
LVFFLAKIVWWKMDTRGVEKRKEWIEVERGRCWFYLPLEQGLWMKLPSEYYCTLS